MHHPLRPSSPRRIASWMLCVWLFALSVSWANACIVPLATTSGLHGHALAAEAGSNDHDATAQPMTPDDTDPARLVCVSFCDSGQDLAVKAQPPSGDGQKDTLATLARADAHWPAFALARSGPPARQLPAPPPPSTSVVIAFLRLTR